LQIYDVNGLAADVPGQNTPQVQHRYFDNPATDQVLASDNGNGSAVLWGLADNEGTIRDIINNSGAVVDHRKYDSFGTMTETAATDYLFGHAGQPFDKTTGLVDDWHRWYAPATGRFLSEDPAAADENLYRYVGNNSLNYTDPSGLCPKSSSNLWSVIGAGAGAYADSFFPGSGAFVGSAVTSLGNNFGNLVNLPSFSLGGGNLSGGASQPSVSMTPMLDALKSGGGDLGSLPTFTSYMTNSGSIFHSVDYDDLSAAVLPVPQASLFSHRHRPQTPL
jgi:RHS repeat-associated protein